MFQRTIDRLVKRHAISVSLPVPSTIRSKFKSKGQTTKTRHEENYKKKLEKIQPTKKKNQNEKSKGEKIKVRNAKREWRVV